MSDPFESPPGTPADELAGGPAPRSAGRSAIAWATVGVLGAGAVAGGLYLARHPGSPSSAASATLTAASGPSAAASPSPAAPKPGQHKHGWPARPGGKFGGGLVGPMMGGLGGPRGDVLHGEATVKTPTGTEVVDTQSGTVSAVDPTKKTVTVKSSDGVSFTYVVDDKTRVVVFAATTSPATPAPSAKPSPPATGSLTDLKVGDTVRVVAVRTGDVRTARSVVDGQPTFGGMPRFGAHGRGGPGDADGDGGAGGAGGPGGQQPALPTPAATGATA